MREQNIGEVLMTDERFEDEGLDDALDLLLEDHTFVPTSFELALAILINCITVEFTGSRAVGRGDSFG